MEFCVMKNTGAVVIACLLACTSVCYSQTSNISDQPSFDCSNARYPVALILCSGPDGARVDWDVNSAWWALYFTIDEKRRPILDADQETWRQSLYQMCALPRQLTQEEQPGQVMAQTMGRFMLGQEIRIPGPQPITQAHVNCVLNAYHARAAMLRSRLKGDALAESRLSPEQHVELQASLAEKGFLRSDQIGSGTHDGEFGPITRSAIKQFQQSLGASPSGFLSNEQKTALLERPGEREARVARLAAEAKAKQDAENARLEAEAKPKQDAQAAAERREKQAAAEAKAKQDAEAKAKQDAQAAAETREKQAAAEAKAKQDAENARLEAEAKAAKQWRQKVDEARVKGGQYADKAEFKWSLSETDDPMTDDKDYTVASTQPNGKGAVATIDGECAKPGRVAFVATLLDASDAKSPLALPDFNNEYIAGMKRINDELAFPTHFPTQKFRNNVVVATLISLSAAESIETTWRVLAEIETGRGRLIVQIPMFNPNVQRLLVACGKQFENANNRRGFVDAPSVQQ
jgi:peptidoglycan hydrolase-like protein with peptidoglycan-binding domain